MCQHKSFKRIQRLKPTPLLVPHGAVLQSSMNETAKFRKLIMEL
jgi:hypothetical protein